MEERERHQNTPRFHILHSRPYQFIQALSFRSFPNPLLKKKGTAHKTEANHSSPFVYLLHRFVPILPYELIECTFNIYKKRELKKMLVTSVEEGLQFRPRCQPPLPLGAEPLCQPPLPLPRPKSGPPLPPNQPPRPPRKPPRPP